MNNYIVDAIIILIFIITFLIGAYRGFIKSVFKTFSSIIALVLAFSLHPVISGIIKSTPVFDAIKMYVADKLNLSLAPAAVAQPEQIKLISSLPLPDFLNEMLIENNNTEVYKLLGANGINDYICGYIANIIINIAVTILLALCMGFIIKAVIGALDLVARLPVIHQLNYLGGGVVGIVSGVIIIWLIFIVLMLFVTDSSYNAIQESIDSSIIGRILFERNIFKDMIMGDLFKYG